MDPEKQITCLKFFSFMNTDHNILIVYETTGNITFLYSERILEDNALTRIRPRSVNYVEGCL